MFGKVCALAISAFLIATPLASSEALAAAKKLTSQQQKMKDCGAKWQEHKKAKNVKGKSEYRKFLSGCLKS